MAKAKSKVTEKDADIEVAVNSVQQPKSPEPSTLEELKPEAVKEILTAISGTPVDAPEETIVVDPEPEVVTPEAVEETRFMTALRMLSQLISGIVYYGVERETEQAKLKIEKARGVLYLAVDPDHDFSLEDQYDGGHYEFKTDDNINKALELRESIGEVKEFIKGSITPEDDQSLWQVPGYLTEAQMWMGMQTKKMRSQYR